MKAYSKFANLYDVFMDDVPYEKWSGVISGLLADEGVKDGIVCELGCGTGTLTRMLADRGFDMIGIDSSEEMLQVAFDREMDFKNTDNEDAPARKPILYLNQDIRDFELYGTVRAFVSVCNTMNYLTGDGELERVLKLVNNYLDPSGIFIFDFNTVHLYRDVIGDSTIAENREDASFIWENVYDEACRINEYDVTFFEKKESGLFERFEEVHIQRAFELEEVKESIKKAGMRFLGAFDAESMEEPSEDSETILVAAGEKGK
ncbi:MAG: class I SAM-dependent DNA methyltransferase [Lachnospiraceae bacterium]